jgi:hypothetical protein
MTSSTQDLIKIAHNIKFRQNLIKKYELPKLAPDSRKDKLCRKRISYLEGKFHQIHNRMELEKNKVNLSQYQIDQAERDIYKRMIVLDLKSLWIIFKTYPLRSTLLIICFPVFIISGIILTIHQKNIQNAERIEFNQKNPNNKSDEAYLNHLMEELWCSFSEKRTFTLPLPLPSTANSKLKN